MALLFGGIVQIIAGFVEVRYDQQLGGTALTMYGFLWVGTSLLGILQTLSNKGPIPTWRSRCSRPSPASPR